MSPIQLPLHYRSRRWLIAAVIPGLALFSAVIFQRAQAQGPTLKPPFKLIRAEQPNSLEPHGPVALPLDAPIVISQTFDSSYVPTLDPSVRGWHQLLGSDATANITWKRVTTGPHPDTVWSAGLNIAGTDFNPATDTYTNGMEALLVYGPINLSDYYRLVMTSTYWLDTAITDPLSDYLGVAYSTDGSNFTEISAQSASDPALSDTQTAFVNLNDVAGKSQVWIAFTFVSNDDNLVGRGAFIKDMVLRGSPFFKVYLPLIRRDPTPTPTPTNTPTNTPTPTPTNTPTPTPTPTATATPSVSYRYFFTFGNGATSNSDFQNWGGVNSTVTSCNGSPCAYYQNIVTLGNPGGAVNLYSYDLNLLGGSGPRQNGTSLSTATNFEYSADFYVYTGQIDARYGLVFDATAGSFPGSGDPPFVPNNYYFLEMRMDTTTRTKVAKWQIKRVVNSTFPADNITMGADLPFPINQGQWHNLKIRQSGTTLTFFLNGYQLPTTGFFDTNNWGPDRRRFGTYIEIRGTNNDGGNPFEVFFDNVAVRDLP